MPRHAHRDARRSGRHAARRSPRGRHARAPRAAGSRVLALAVVPVVLAGSSAAYAYWSATGTGTTTVTTGTAAALTLGSSATPPPLHPGRTVDVALTVTNPNPYAVTLTRLTAVIVVSGDPTGCPATTLEVPSPPSGGTALATAVQVPANGTGTLTLPGLVTMSTQAPDTCQGDTFTLDLALSGEQVA